MRAVMRCVAPLAEAEWPLGVVASEPLVARLAAHAVAFTELGHGGVATLVIGDELQALVHGCSLQPGHPTPRERAALELECHQSTRFVPPHRLTWRCS